MQFSTDLETASYINKLTLLPGTKQTVTSTWQNTWNTRARCWGLSSRKQLLNSWENIFSLIVPSIHSIAHKRPSPGSMAWSGYRSAVLHRGMNQGSPFLLCSCFWAVSTGQLETSLDQIHISPFTHNSTDPKAAAKRGCSSPRTSPGRPVLRG